MLKQSSHADQNAQTVGDRLDIAMRNASIRSQSELSRKSGVPQPTIARILKNSGKSQPESGTVKKLAIACGVSFAWLNDGSDLLDSLTTEQVEWLKLMDFLGKDDLEDFKSQVRERQARNKRLLQEYGAVG